MHSKSDFVPIKLYNTSVVTLGASQRVDVLVIVNGLSIDSIFIRSNISAKCVSAPNALALAAIFYEDADQSKTPPNNPTPFDDSNLPCGNVSYRLNHCYLVFRRLPDFSFR